MPINFPEHAFLNNDKQASSRVGKDVRGYCSRCKMNLAHTIVTLNADNKPDRVQCNTCKSERTYRAPKEEAAPKTQAGGKKMAERDEDLDLDSPDVAKALLGDKATKKKPKAKAKAKKKDDGESRSASKTGPSIPLSMLAGSPEDIAHFETKLLQLKNSLANAKDYKASLRFNTGEIVNHATFGTGFVVAENGLNKIEVLFRAGRKLLVTALKS